MSCWPAWSLRPDGRRRAWCRTRTGESGQLLFWFCVPRALRRTEEEERKEEEELRSRIARRDLRRVDETSCASTRHMLRAQGIGDERCLDMFDW